MGGFHAFTLAKVPVSISPWYLVLLAMFSMRAGSLPAILAVAGAVTFSLLVHEYGHALVAQRLRLSPRILLHGMGGLCAHERSQSNRDDALITAAGPLLQLGLGLVIRFGLLPLMPLHLPLLALFVSVLVQVSIFWSVLNLIPVHPLDGGVLFRLLMLRLFRPIRAERATHVVSLAVLAGLVVAMRVMQYDHFFGYLLVIFFAMHNLRGLREGSGEPVSRTSQLAVELLAAAEDAWADGNDDEAVRLCHQLRSESNVDPKTLARAWHMLGVAATRRESYDEAISYLKRAPVNRETVEARAQCLYQLDEMDALRELTESPDFRKLDAETRAQVQQALE